MSKERADKFRRELQQLTRAWYVQREVTLDRIDGLKQNKELIRNQFEKDREMFRDKRHKFSDFVDTIEAASIDEVDKLVETAKLMWQDLYLSFKVFRGYERRQ